MSNFYMHTLNGSPATFDGGQICYAVKTRPLRLCVSLAEIKQQRRRSLTYRQSKGFHDMSDKYGHLRVTKP